MVGDMVERFPVLRHRLTRWLLAVTGLGILGGIWARSFWLSFPEKRVFDEVYFPVFAQKYLYGVNVFDVHPPLGKFIIAAGIWLFGDGGIGWRIMPLLFGLGIILLMGVLVYRHTGSKLAGWLAAFLVAIDGIFIIYSRTGLMDGILFFFMFLTLLVMLRPPKYVGMLLVALLLGFTVAIKWVGLAIIVPLLYLAVRQKRLPEFLFSLWWAFAAYVMIVAYGQYLNGQQDLLQALVEWHMQASQYHARLTDTHPWASPWWSWPLLMRPVLFLYDVAGDARVQIMTSLGNPLLWWGSTLAVIGSFFYLVYERFVRGIAVAAHPLILPLIGWAAAFLPWAMVERVVFLYHYMPAYGFALMIVAYWGARLYRVKPEAVVGIAALLLVVSVYFLPLAVGWWPVSPEQLKAYIWIRSWLY
jgi:dolichyl-phosphate-mannose-protein mannosyltransferase